MIWLVILGLLLAFRAVGLWIGRGHLPSGRLGRLARIGRMSAALSASWFGAKVRRVFASRAGRARIDEAQRAAVAKRVTMRFAQADVTLFLAVLVHERGVLLLDLHDVLAQRAHVGIRRITALARALGLVLRPRLLLVDRGHPARHHRGTA